MGKAASAVEQLADRIIQGDEGSLSHRSDRNPHRRVDRLRIRPIDGATVDDLILKADLALYQAKDAGRGCARYCSSELQSEQEDRSRLESDLRQAIASAKFHLVFQPLINARKP